MDCSMAVGLHTGVSWVLCMQGDKLLKNTGTNVARMHEAAGRGPYESRQSPV